MELELTIVDAAADAPPAFNWDDWYTGIGGRSPMIPEVAELRRQIVEEQYPRFDGAVSPDRREFASPEEAAGAIKAKAAEFGADIVGICEIGPEDIYRGKIVAEKYAIAVGMRMEWRAFQTVPSTESAIECMRMRSARPS